MVKTKELAHRIKLRIKKIETEREQYIYDFNGTDSAMRCTARVEELEWVLKQLGEKL